MDDFYLKRMALLGTIFKVNNLFQTVDERHYIEITQKQESLLFTVEYAFPDYPPTLNELAEFMGSSHQNIKQIVLRLQKKGYLYLEQDKTDKRKRRIRLTEKYENNKDFFARRFEGFVDNVFKDINESDISIAKNILEKIAERQIGFLK